LRAMPMPFRHCEERGDEAISSNPSTPGGRLLRPARNDNVRKPGRNADAPSDD
jgi:hypothetical protein